MARKVSERTNNNFKIRVLVGKEIGIDRSEFPDALSKGAIDMAWLLSPVMSGIYPFLGVFDLPNLTTTQESTIKVNVAVQSMLNEAVKSAGYTILPNGFFAWFPQDLLSRNPIPNLANLKGLKIRVWRAPDAELIHTLGGDAIYMPVSEVYTSMQRGVMDALNTGAQSMVENSMWEIGKHYYAIRLEPGVTWTAVNEKKWKDLPAEYKTILSEELAECQKRIMANYDVEVGKQKQILVGKGIAIHEPSAAESKAWVDASRSLWATWAAKDARNKQALEASVKALGL
jgi:TRAP-type C4-dicarboxylate transport system substrate-binding protein